MTNTEVRLLYERKLKARGHKCPVCGKPMTDPQCAHIVPKYKNYIKKYGKTFIHSELNTIMVCSLHCNSAVMLNPATHPVEVQELYRKWKKAYLK